MALHHVRKNSHTRSLTNINNAFYGNNQTQRLEMERNASMQSID